MRLGSWEGGERPSTQRLRVGRGLHSLGPCAMPGASSFLGPEAENGCLQIAGTGRCRWDGCWSARNVTTMSTGWRGLGPSRHPGSGRRRRWAPDVGPGAHDSPRVLGDGHTRGSATAESKHPQRCPAAVGLRAWTLESPVSWAERSGTAGWHSAPHSVPPSGPGAAQPPAPSEPLVQARSGSARDPATCPRLTRGAPQTTDCHSRLVKAPLLTKAEKCV